MRPPRHHHERNEVPGDQCAKGSVRIVLGSGHPDCQHQEAEHHRREHHRAGNPRLHEHGRKVVVGESISFLDHPAQGTRRQLVLETAGRGPGSAKPSPERVCFQAIDDQA